MEKKKKGKLSKCPDISILEDLYINQGLTALEIAKQFNVLVYTVRGWIYKARKK